MRDDETGEDDGADLTRVTLRLGARTWRFDRQVSPPTARLLTVAVVLSVVLAAAGLLAVAAAVAWLIAQAV